jgi:rhodanese-related sulfurtransferase
MTPKAGSLSVKLGYTNIRVMLEGIPAWKKAGNIITPSEQFVKTGNIVLLDLRDPAAYEAGHIPRAVNVPLATLAEREDAFPVKAPAVVYGATDEDAIKAYKAMKKWGVNMGSVWLGGTAAWTGRGNELAQGPSPASIEWTRILAKGEASVADFLKAAAGDPGMVVLDVREDSEIGEGVFANSIHIPLSKLDGRLGEMPKDKELLIHCATGVRAEMAWKAVEKAGLKGRFLMANVECEAGKCEVTD